MRIWVSLLIFFMSFLTSWAQASDPVSITLLHTNDLHSHFRPEKTPLSLGGIARLKTLVDQQRSLHPNSLLLDGGDWSEGDIYYTQGAGREVLKMMDLIGYDVAVVGNHDWLNGPDVLLDAINSALPQLTLVGANFDVTQYSRAAEFHKAILPYVVREFNGAKVAIIGISTYEKVFDHFISPVKITEPYLLTRQLAAQLKKTGKADAVVVISHNSIYENQALLLAAPDVDLVIGAHDHKKLTEPLIVRGLRAHPGWVVEAECWGKYLGKVELSITPADASRSKPSQVELRTYQLLQVDKTIAEDALITDRIEVLEHAIEQKSGNIFSDHVADSELEMTRSGPESPLGDFLMDSYRSATGTDIALDYSSLVYGNLHEGPLNTVDFYNMNPAVYNPFTEKNWTLKIVKIRGKVLMRILRILCAIRDLPFGRPFYVSGVNLVVHHHPDPGPDLKRNISVEPLDFGKKDFLILVENQPIDPDRVYSVTIGNGMLEAFEFVRSLSKLILPLEGPIQDTGLESWRCGLNYARELSPITSKKIPQLGNRIQTMDSNLQVHYDEVRWSPLKVSIDGTVDAELSVTIHNAGQSASEKGKYSLQLAVNRHGNDLTKKEDFLPQGEATPIDPIAPGESRTYLLPAQLKLNRGTYSIHLSLGRFQLTRYFDEKDLKNSLFSHDSDLPEKQLPLQLRLQSARAPEHSPQY